MLADIGTLSGEAKKRVEEWVKKGGVLVRFAGPRLEKGGDDLLPVPLRARRAHARRRAVVVDAAAAGALRGRQPVRRPDGAAGSHGQPAGAGRSGAARPGGARCGRACKDGTPLVTARKRGDGQIILFHVTANSDWSNLPLSGLFVEMLRRIASARHRRRRQAAATAAPRPSAAPRPTGRRCCRRCRRSTASACCDQPPPTAQPIAAAQDARRSCRASTIRPATMAPAARRARSTCSAPKSLLTPLPVAADRRRAAASTRATARTADEAAAARWSRLALLFADIVAVLLLQARRLALGRRAAPRPRCRDGRRAHRRGHRHCSRAVPAARAQAAGAPAPAAPSASEAAPTSAPSRRPARSRSATC